MLKLLLLLLLNTRKVSFWKYASLKIIHEHTQELRQGLIWKSEDVEYES
jgi:hypothetical protein